MISQLWKFNVALLWSVLGLPLGYVCIGRICGWLARALSEPNVSMDYTPFIALSGWAVVLYGLATMVRVGTNAIRHSRHDADVPFSLTAAD